MSTEWKGFSIRIPSDLVEWLDAQASEQMRTRNNLVWMLLKQAQEQQEAQEVTYEPA